MIVAVNGFILNDSTAVNRVYLDEPIDGLDLAPIRTSSGTYSGRDGGYVGAQFYGARSINMTGRIKAADIPGLWSTRRAFQAAVAIGTILLTISTDDGGLYAVNCYIDDLNIPIKKNKTSTTWTMSLIAPDPTIYDNSGSGLNAVSIAPVGGGGVTWPIAWTPIVWAAGSLPQTVTNTGNVASFPKITLTGPATNPTITNVTTGQFFTIQGLTTTGTDVITIDMLNRTVLLNGGPILTYVTVTSSWWPLLPGANSIRLTTTNSADTVTGTVSWRSGYRGI